MDADASVFGTPAREKILVFLAVKGRSHASELAPALDMTVAGTAKAIRQLERSGAVAATTHGRTRLVQLNPRWYAKAELRALLERMADARPELVESMSRARSRPRRSGKEL